MRRRAAITGVIIIALLAVAGIGLFVAGVLTQSTTSLMTGGMLLGLVTVFSAGATLSVAREMTVERNQQRTMVRNMQRRHESDLRRVQADFESLRRGAEEPDPRLTSLETHVGRTSEHAEALQVTLIGHQRQLAILRKRMPTDSLETLQQGLASNRLDLASIQQQVEDIDQRSLESALYLGKPPAAILDAAQAATMVRSCIQTKDFVSALPLIRAFDVLYDLTLAQSRRLYRFLRGAGYWDLALRVLEVIAQRSQNDNDRLTVKKIRSELSVYRDPRPQLDNLPAGTAFDPHGPVLHVVGRVLPHTQSGYTLRTHYTAVAQADAGLRPVVVGQSGAQGSDSGSADIYMVEGIEYRILTGTPRQDQLLEDWLNQDARLLAECVLEVRPSVLHAHSDFLNGALALAVGRHFGIPVVYESRGFWEESWLSRIVDTHGWRGRDEWIFASNGLPLAYSARQRAEELVRQEADHVFTLANVMREHILDSPGSPLDAYSVSTVPNAVDPTQFPVQTRDVQLAEHYGIHPDAVVVGYISSLVEYEGIDTLLRGFAEAQHASDRPLQLLLVGDGPMTDRLKAIVREDNIPHVTFTGRVPHEDILRYYGLIDIFVVPRTQSRVTNLVTPLKPFEAFATGRAVVMSDVNALDEIAGQSGACVTFEADNHRSLAAVLFRLIEDPALRAELATQGAKWVRSNRTWNSNVSRYLRIYEDHGYQGSVSSEIACELALLRDGIDPGGFVADLANGETAPLTGWFKPGITSISAESLWEGGWRFSEFPAVLVQELNSLEAWAQYAAENRSWGYNLHTMAFLDPLLVAFDQSQDTSWLEKASSVVTTWLRVHEDPDDEIDSMAWYDMAIALRTPRLVALAQRLARFDSLRHAALIVGCGVSTHLAELAKDRAFNATTNHGFFTAASQVHVAKHLATVPGAAQARLQGSERLATMVETQFASDGVHREHSPDYHNMMLYSFEEAMSGGLVADEEVARRIRRAAYALGWMIQPHGTLVQFGDTPAKPTRALSSRASDPRTRYITSNGDEGEPPSQEMEVFREGGYAFVRTFSVPLSESAYLAFSAAFHSRAHKHADDLTVVWSERGHEILVDGGRFGYGQLLPADSPMRSQGFYYSQPERQYVEGTMAHNTLMMDGTDQDRRSREPYGSGLTECFQTESSFELSGRVHHGDYVHRRRLVFRPENSLLFKDSVFSHTSESREGVLWFNLAGNFQLESHTHDTVVFTAPERELRLLVESSAQLIVPVKGQRDPLRGWRSRKDRTLEPTWSFGFSFDVGPRASVDTLFRWL